MKQKLATLICICCIIICSENGQKLHHSEDVVEYAKLTPSDFRQKIAKAPIAYLPLGTIEWHGEHLPLGSDGLQSLEFMKLLAENVGGIVMPILFLGPDSLIQKNGKDLHGIMTAHSTSQGFGLKSVGGMIEPIKYGIETKNQFL